MKIGFVGVGNLGYAMAKRLIQQGERLTVWNRTREKSQGLSAYVARTPAEVASGSDVVILNLFDTGAVRQVMTMADGVLTGTCEGKIIIDTTTNHPLQVGELHTLVRAKGGQYLEAPVLGSVGPAAEGKLTMLVSGDESTLEQVKPLVQKLCKDIYFLGEPGVATRMKLVNNFVLASFMAAIAEAGSLGEKAGIPLPTVLSVLAAGAGNSGVLNAKKEKIVRKDFSPQFSVAAIKKDLTYLGDLLDEIEVNSSALPPLRQAFEEAVRKGWAAEDFSAVYKVF